MVVVRQRGGGEDYDDKENIERDHDGEMDEDSRQREKQRW